MSEKNMGVLVFVLAGFALWRSLGGHMSGMMGMMYGGGYMAFLPLAVGGSLVLGGHLVLTELTRPRSIDTPALRILDTRYARGEITRAQYRQMQRELDS